MTTEKAPRFVALDRLSNALHEAERALFDLNLGVAAQVPLGADCTLSWQKVDNVWALWVVVHVDGIPRSVDEVSVARRMAAAQSLGALLREMDARAQDDRDDMNNAAMIAEEFAACVRMHCVVKT